MVKYPTAMMTGYGQDDTPRETTIRPYRGQQAKNRGWSEAVSHTAPGEVSKFYEHSDKAKAKIERHPNFTGWKKEPRDT